MSFQVYIVIYIFFMITKVNRSTKSVILQISKDHKKTNNGSPIKFSKLSSIIIDQFYLLISLERMWSFFGV